MSHFMRRFSILVALTVFSSALVLTFALRWVANYIGSELASKQTSSISTSTVSSPGGNEMDDPNMTILPERVVYIVEYRGFDEDLIDSVHEQLLSCGIRVGFEGSICYGTYVDKDDVNKAMDNLLKCNFLHGQGLSVLFHGKWVQFDDAFFAVHSSKH